MFYAFSIFRFFSYLTRSLDIYFVLFLCHFLNKKTYRKGKDFLYMHSFWRKIRSRIAKSHVTNAFLNTLIFLLHRNMIFRRKVHTRMIFYTWYNKTIQHTHSTHSFVWFFIVFAFAWTKLLQFYLSWNYYYLQRPQLSARFSYIYVVCMQ